MAMAVRLNVLVFVVLARHGFGQSSSPQSTASSCGGQEPPSESLFQDVDSPGKSRMQPFSFQDFQALAKSFDFSSAPEAAVQQFSQGIYAQLSAEFLDSPDKVLMQAVFSVFSVAHGQGDFPGILAKLLSQKLFPEAGKAQDIFLAEADKTLRTTDVLRAICADVAKAVLTDPALEGLVQPIVFFKGFHALSSIRVAHNLWGRGRKHFALLLQSLVSEKFGVDIHPGATIGNGVMLDHATSVVIGGTAVIGNDVYMLHEVTLGATGKPTDGQRHPTIGSHDVLGAGARIIGNIKVGDGVKVGAAAFVSKDVPNEKSVIGINKILGG